MFFLYRCAMVESWFDLAKLGIVKVTFKTLPRLNVRNYQV